MLGNEFLKGSIIASHTARLVVYRSVIATFDILFGERIANTLGKIYIANGEFIVIDIAVKSRTGYSHLFTMSGEHVSDSLPLVTNQRCDEIIEKSQTFFPGSDLLSR